MATIKSYTDLSQSKKLAEILPLESADMYYQYVLPKSDKIKHNPEIGNPINALEWYNKGYVFSGKEPIKMDEFCVPCWSLAALLNVLKDKITFGGNSPEGWFCCYTIKNPTKTLTIYRDSLVDACVDMIIKLHEENLL